MAGTINQTFCLLSIIRAQYPATLRPVRINCSGRVTPSLMMRAIGKGADGIVIGA